MSKTNVFRDNKIHVCRRMCSTCIFTDHSPVSVERRDQMAHDASEQDGCIPCHHTIHNNDERGEAVCRGFYNLGSSVPIRLATAMKLIEWVNDIPEL